MENASKALIMAGEILIGMLILGIIVAVSLRLHELASAYETVEATGEIEKFNTNFTKFIGRTDITAHEIVTLVNFCNEYKLKNEEQLSVIVNGLGEQTGKTKEQLIEFIKEQSYKTVGTSTEQVYFSCTQENSIEYTEEGKVSRITFNKTI